MPDRRRFGLVFVLALLLAPAPSFSQIAPSEAEVVRYSGLHAAAAAGNVAEIERLLAAACRPE